MAASICLGLKPARPSSAIALATCAAVKLVVRPSSLAVAVSRSNSACVAPVTALVFRIASSNPANARTANANGAAITPAKAIIRLPMAVADCPNRLSRRWARFRPRTRRLLLT